MPKVSVIIPIRDSVDFLAECLASVEMQSLEDIEGICIDGGSTDATLSVYQLFANDNDIFTLIEDDHAVNRVTARNIGIAHAHGDYLAFLDSSDWYPDANALELLVTAAEDADACVAGGSCRMFDNRTDTLHVEFEDGNRLCALIFEEEGRVEFKDWQNDLGLNRFIFKRAFINEQSITFPSQETHADEVFLVKALVAAEWFQAIPNPVYSRRYNHVPRQIGEHMLEEGADAISELLAICSIHGFDVLKNIEVEALKRYAIDSIGLVLAEPKILRARAGAIRNITQSKTYKHISDIAGSYRTYVHDVLSQYSLD